MKLVNIDRIYEAPKLLFVLQKKLYSSYLTNTDRGQVAILHTLRQPYVQIYDLIGWLQ